MYACEKLLSSNQIYSKILNSSWSDNCKHLFKFYMELSGISGTSFQVFDYAELKGKRQRTSYLVMIFYTNLLSQQSLYAKVLLNIFPSIKLIRCQKRFLNLDNLFKFYMELDGISRTSISSFWLCGNKSLEKNSLKPIYFAWLNLRLPPRLHVTRARP